MAAYHKFISVILGVLFVVVLQIFAVPLPVFRFLVPAFFVYMAILGAYNYYYLYAIHKYNPWLFIKPLILVLAGFAFFLLMPNDFFRSSYLFIAAIVVSAFEMFLGNFSESVQINEMLIIAFAGFVSICAFNQYFPPYHFLFVLSVFAFSFLLARSFYEVIPQSEGVKLVTSVAMALFITEIFWALTFLPFHYSALAMVLFNIFYFITILNYFYFFNILNFKKLQFHLILLGLFIVVTILATPWKILS